MSSESVLPIFVFLRSSLSLIGFNGAALLVFDGDRLEALERVAQNPRDVHLRDPEPLADLPLGQLLFEAQTQDLAFALWQLCQPALQHDAAFYSGQFVVLATEGLRQRRAVVLVRRLVERVTELAVSG